MPGEAWVIMNDIDPHINDWFRFTATFPELGMLQVSACHGNCCFDEAKYINWVVMPTVDGITANEPIPQAQYRSNQEVDVPACK